MRVHSAWVWPAADRRAAATFLGVGVGEAQLLQGHTPVQWVVPRLTRRWLLVCGARGGGGERRGPLQQLASHLHPVPCDHVFVIDIASGLGGLGL
jgi:hypothetical protein